jgi:hypothetical protein
MRRFTRTNHAWQREGKIYDPFCVVSEKVFGERICRISGEQNWGSVLVQDPEIRFQLWHIQILRRKTKAMVTF